MKQSTKQKKHRKYGRNKGYATLRAALGLDERNKARRILRHGKRMEKKARKKG